MISLAMICRNNDDTIGAALASVKPYVDEMVLVDTGSTDKTIAIAFDGGADYVHASTWKDDFSYHRNFSLSLCREPWILWMDSDEVLTPEGGKRLRGLCESAGPEIGGFTYLQKSPNMIVERVGLIRNDPRLRFVGRVHEQIVPSLKKAGYLVEQTDIIVEHHQDKIDRNPRNLELLKMQVADYPQSPYWLHKLGHTYLGQEQYEDAIHYFIQAKECSNPDDSYMPKLYSYLTLCYLLTNRLDEARATAHEGTEKYPHDPEVLFYWSMVAHTEKRWKDAENGYSCILKMKQSLFEADPRLHIKTRHNLAAVYEDTKDYPKALQQWQMIINSDSTYKAAWEGLCRCCDTIGYQRGLMVAQSA